MTDEQPTTPTEPSGAEAQPKTDPSPADFSAEQQARIDKIIGERLSRAKSQWEAEQEQARKQRETEAQQRALKDEKKFEQLLTQHEAKIAELEPALKTHAEQLAAYQATVEEILAARVKAVGPAAQTALDNLPGQVDALAKLKWLNANEGLFKPAEAAAAPRGGTPPGRASRIAGLYRQQTQNNQTNEQPAYEPAVRL